MTDYAHKGSSYMNLQSLQSDGIEFAGKDGDSHFYTFYGDDGYGRLRMRLISPGVVLMHDEYRMPRCSSAFSSQQDMFILDFCREGRLDYSGKKGHAGYFEAGDLCIADRSDHAGSYRFPLSHYVGAAVGFDMAYLKEHSRERSRFPVDIRRLQSKFLGPGERRLLRKDPFVARVFAGFYDAPSTIGEEYYRCLVAELLLYLDAIDPLKTSHIAPTLDRGNVDKIFAMRSLMVDDLERHLTVKELSERFDMPASTLKSCFKEVYGAPVFTYMRAYRINKAAAMLAENPKLSISDAAAYVGYANPSKFSEAFREIMGYLPKEYRRRYLKEQVLYGKLSAPNQSIESRLGWNRRTS